MREQVVKSCRAIGCGWVLAIAWGVAGAVPAANTPQPGPSVQAVELDDHMAATVDATKPRSPDALVQQSAGASHSERDWVQSTVKELASTTGAAEVARGLNAELNKAKADAVFDILRDTEADAANQERRQAETQARDAGRIDATVAPLTEEQRKLEGLQAASMFVQLMEEVKPWVLGALALYAVFYAGRLALAYSRANASRKSLRAARRSRSRSGSSRGPRL